MTGLFHHSFSYLQSKLATEDQHFPPHHRNSLRLSKQETSILLFICGSHTPYVIMLTSSTFCLPDVTRGTYWKELSLHCPRNCLGRSHIYDIYMRALILTYIPQKSPLCSTTHFPHPARLSVENGLPCKP